MELRVLLRNDILTLAFRIQLWELRTCTLDYYAFLFIRDCSRFRDQGRLSGRKLIRFESAMPSF